MVIDNTLLFLLLGALTLIIIVLFALSANLLIESRQSQKLKLDKMAQIARETPHECAHSFGYLSSLSRHQSIPNECFGCLLAIDCVKAKPKPAKTETDKRKQALTFIETSYRE